MHNEKFLELYDAQKEFTVKFFKEKYNLGLEDIQNNQDLKVKWNKEYILALSKEVFEMLDELDWKSHTTKDTADIRDNFLEEGIDVMKYLLGTFIINGFTAEEVWKKFFEKSNVVNAKYEQEKSIKRIKENSDKIAFVDIDGVLGKWPEKYIEFVNVQLGTRFTNLPELLLNTDKKLQLKLKEEYRLSGIKADLDVVDGSQEFLENLKEDGYDIILLTARPYKKYFRIYSDTLAWLDKNKFVYDAIIFDEEKEKYIINRFDTENVKFVIDDDISNAKKLTKAGFNVYLKTNKAYYEGYDIQDLKKHNIKLVNNYSFAKRLKYVS
tara:strand:- start:380 stop:1351 length:972 start_codon:yes stop_codon:yes gene_type:complete